MPANMTVHDDTDQERQLIDAAAARMPVTVATFRTAFGTFRVRKRNTPGGPAYSLTADTAVGAGLIDRGDELPAQNVPLEADDDDHARRVGLCMVWNGLVAAMDEVNDLCRAMNLPELEQARPTKGRRK